MNTSTMPVGSATDLPRAGFWRRWLATLIDSIIVMLPFQILAAILFAVTAGGIQMNSGFFKACEPATAIPKALDPPPPHDSNFANVCHVSFFGATTGASLTVGRATREGTITTRVSQTYTLDADGKPVRGTSIDQIVWLALVAYLIGMVWRSGRSFGARIAKVRVIDTAQPDAPGVPLGKTIFRYLAMAIGAVPLLAVVIHQRFIVGGNADAMAAGGFFTRFMVAGGLALLWLAVLAFQMARKRDPFYDRLAGTAVVRG